MGKWGSDCFESEIVSELEDCRAAATRLERLFENTTTNSKRPSGCYWSTNDSVWLNVANPSDIKDISQRSGGVCRKSMLYIF